MKRTINIEKVVTWLRGVLADVDNVVVDMEVVSNENYVNVKHPTGELIIEGGIVNTRINDIDYELELKDVDYSRILDIIVSPGVDISKEILGRIEYLENIGEDCTDFVGFSRGEYMEFVICDTSRYIKGVVKFRKVKEGVIEVTDILNDYKYVIRKYSNKLDKITYRNINVLIPKGLYNRIEEVINKGICDIKEVLRWIKTVVNNINNDELDIKDIVDVENIGTDQPVLKIKHNGTYFNISDVIEFGYEDKNCTFEFNLHSAEYMEIMDVANELYTKYIDQK